MIENGYNVFSSIKLLNFATWYSRGIISAKYQFNKSDMIFFTGAFSSVNKIVFIAYECLASIKSLSDKKNAKLLLTESILLLTYLMIINLIIEI